MKTPVIENSELVGAVSTRLAQAERAEARQAGRVYHVDNVMKREIQVVTVVYDVAITLLRDLPKDQRFTQDQIDQFRASLRSELLAIQAGELDSYRIVLESRDRIPRAGRLVDLTPELRNIVLEEYRTGLVGTLEAIVTGIFLDTRTQIGDFETRLQAQIEGGVEAFSRLQELNVVLSEEGFDIQRRIRALNEQRATLFNPPTTDMYSASQNGDVQWLRDRYQREWADLRGRFFNTPQKESGFMPLHFAAYHGREAVVAYLLDNGRAKVKAADPMGYTALHFAAKAGHVATVQALLERRAPMEARGEYGRTPLHMAVYNDRGETVEELLRKGANVNALAEHSQTVLHYTVTRTNLGMLGRLLAFEVNRQRLPFDLTLKDQNGDTPLRQAVKDGLHHFVILLLNDPRWREQRPTDPDDPSHLDQLLQLTPRRNVAQVREALNQYRGQ